MFHGRNHYQLDSSVAVVLAGSRNSPPRQRRTRTRRTTPPRALHEFTHSDASIRYAGAVVRTAMTSPYLLIVPVEEFVCELVRRLVYFSFSADDIQCGSFRYGSIGTSSAALPIGTACETRWDGTGRSVQRRDRCGVGCTNDVPTQRRRDETRSLHSTAQRMRYARSLARPRMVSVGRSGVASASYGRGRRKLVSRSRHVPSSGWWRQHKGGDQWVGGLEPAASPVGVSQVVRCAAKTRLSGGKYRRREETRRDETGRDSGGCLRYAIHMEVADFTATLRTPAAKRL